MHSVPDSLSGMQCQLPGNPFLDGIGNRHEKEPTTSNHRVGSLVLNTQLPPAPGPRPRLVPTSAESQKAVGPWAWETKLDRGSLQALSLAWRDGPNQARAFCAVINLLL